MRRTEIKRKRNLQVRVREEETGNERKGGYQARGRSREREKDGKTERRHIGTRHPSARCLSFALLSQTTRNREARKYHIYRGSFDSRQSYPSLTGEPEYLKDAVIELISVIFRWRIGGLFYLYTDSETYLVRETYLIYLTYLMFYSLFRSS